jgi:hypothetical protein
MLGLGHAVFVSSHGAPICYPSQMDPKLRKVVILVAILSLAYFGLEF